MANTSAPAADKDMGGGYGKKKRTNRTAKLKQCKLDARREQWLSQVKNKDCAAAENEHSAAPPSMSPPSPPILPRNGKPDGGSSSSPEARPRRDLHSLVNSPISRVSGNHCSPRQDFRRSISSGGSSTTSVSDADEGAGEDIRVEGGGGLDDWEAIADALTTKDGGKSPPNSKHNVAPPGSVECKNGNGILKRPEPDRTITRAWRPDDVFRPRSLPNLSKQRSLPLDFGQGARGWAHHGIISQPSSCPICYEDLDLTDSSFLPCLCGFRLCLFCHKRILEADGRCPGCRKQYSPVGSGEMAVGGGGVPLLSLQLSRSCRLSLRS